MKTLIAVVAISTCLSFAARAEDLTEVTQAAFAVEHAFEDVSFETFTEADRLMYMKNTALGTEYDRVSDQASFLSRLFHREVMRALQMSSIAMAEQKFAMVERDYLNLRAAIQRLGALPADVNVAVESLNRAWGMMTSALTTGPITATCSVNTGGNLIEPKTNIECTIFGKGAVGYSGVIRGKSNSVNVHGTLSPGQTSFATDKVKVGYGAGFVMYLVNGKGQQTLVAQQEPR